MAINFTPLTTVSMFRDCLRVWFSQNGGPDFLWDEDPKQSKIWIGTANDPYSREKAGGKNIRGAMSAKPSAYRTKPTAPFLR